MNNAWPCNRLPRDAEQRFPWRVFRPSCIKPQATLSDLGADRVCSRKLGYLSLDCLMTS